MPIGRDQPREIRVLVIDDNGDFADLTAEMLKTDHPEFQVEIATDPTVVLECLDEGIDCLVSDYEMPEMDGIELLQAVREEHPDLPFILFTGKGSETIASEAISAGVTDYLQKSSCPDQYDILAQRITNAVEKQRAQQRVQQSLEAIETATAGISLLGGNGEFIYVNDAYATIFGYNREELLGEHWEILYRDEDVPEIRESILPAARDGIWRGESTHLDKDGNPVVTDHTLTYADDNTLVCTVDDITEKKRITNELRLKERAMDAAPIGVTIADATRDDEPIMYANDGFVELTGNSKEQILGENCRFLQGEGTSGRTPQLPPRRGGILESAEHRANSRQGRDSDPLRGLSGRRDRAQADRTEGDSVIEPVRRVRKRPLTRPAKTTRKSTQSNSTRPKDQRFGATGPSGQ